MNFLEFERTWIVAEIGVNHEGNEETAAMLIDQAAAAGADAVKFQTYVPAGYISTVQPERLERVGRFQLSYEAFSRLSKHAASRGVVFFSTPLAPADVDALDAIAPVFKVSSGDLTHLTLIRHAASKGKPIILSTGLGTEEEIDAAVRVVLDEQPRARANGALMLMHCVASYPTDAQDANLRNIEWLRDRFELPIGYSDHTLGIKAAELAVALGAIAIEKHFTDRKGGRTFHDHLLSVDVNELREMVASVRSAETFLGHRERVRIPAEEAGRAHLRRSIAAAIDIAPGVPVSKEQLTLLRPAWGLPPDAMSEVVGRTLNRAVPAGDLLRREDLA